MIMVFLFVNQHPLTLQLCTFPLAIIERSQISKWQWEEVFKERIRLSVRPILAEFVRFCSIVKIGTPTLFQRLSLDLVQT